MPRCEGGRDAAGTFGPGRKQAGEEQCPAVKGVETTRLPSVSVMSSSCEEQCPAVKGVETSSDYWPRMVEARCEEQCPAVKGVETPDERVVVFRVVIA